MEHITTTSRPDFTVLRPAADEELVNAITHGIGLALAAVGTLVMMTGVTAHGNSRLAVGCAAYLFTSGGRLRDEHRLAHRHHAQVADVLPATRPGVYFPADRGNVHALLHGVPERRLLVVLLAFMWCFALAGFASKAVFAHRIDTGSILPYLFLGWMTIIALPAIWQVAPSRGVRPDPRRRRVLHDRHVLPAQRHEGAALPRGLAPVGDRGKHLPLHGPAGVRRAGGA